LGTYKEAKLDQDKDLVEDQGLNMVDSLHQHLSQPLSRQDLEDQIMQQLWLIPEPQVLEMARLDSLAGVPVLVGRQYKEPHSKPLHHNTEQLQQQLLQEPGPTNPETDKRWVEI
jgi:proteasome lid subunit RPN8/RPN11